MTTLHADPDAIIRAIERHQRAKRRHAAIWWAMTLAVVLAVVVPVVWAVWR